MAAYIIRRSMMGVVTVWLVTLLVFIGLRVVVPAVYGDVVDVIAGEYGRSDPALMEKLREQYGLTQNLASQYVGWVGDLVKGNLGTSLFNGRSIFQEMGDRLPVSLELGVIGLLSAIFIAIPMGIISALMQDRWPDYLLRTYAVGSTSVPNFWVAIMIITFGSIWFRWAPPLHYTYFFTDPIQHLKIMLLPGLLIGLTPSGGLLRIMRSQMLEVLRQDYVRTARAKGLNERTVLVRHALRNSLIPIVTIIGLELPNLIAGTVLFEVIFSLPGMGLYIYSSIMNLDYPVVQGINVVFAVLIVASNLLVDVSYGFIDPRIRFQ